MQAILVDNVIHEFVNGTVGKKITKARMKKFNIIKTEVSNGQVVMTLEDKRVKPIEVSTPKPTEVLTPRTSQPHIMQMSANKKIVLPGSDGERVACHKREPKPFQNKWQPLKLDDEGRKILNSKLDDSNFTRRDLSKLENTVTHARVSCRVCHREVDIPIGEAQFVEAGFYRCNRCCGG